MTGNNLTNASLLVAEIKNYDEASCSRKIRRLVSS